MFPQTISIDNIVKDSDNSKMGKSFLFDFEKGDFVLKDGRLIETQDTQAIKMWIEKILRTEKFRFKVYEREDKREYGVTIKDLLVGQNLPGSFIEAEIKREVIETLIHHSKIQSISNLQIQRNDERLTIEFKVNLSGNSTFIQEVNI